MLAASATPIGIFAIARLWKGIAISTLTRDPNAIGNLSFYAGFLSQLGIFFWASAFSVTTFTSLLLWKYRSTFKTRVFLLSSSTVTLILLIDDTFLLHESAFPGFGISEKVVFCTFVGAMASYLVIFAKRILQTEFIYLFISLSFFGFSMILDITHLTVINHFFFEDGTKFVGIVSWTFYFWKVSKSAILEQTAIEMPQQDGI